MSTLEGLRHQIDTAEDLKSVVTTMKSLAAVSIRQYERAVEALEDYNRVIEMGFQIALPRESVHLEGHQIERRTGAVVFGSDQSMCGRFNEEIAAFVHECVRDDTKSSSPRPPSIVEGPEQAQEDPRKSESGQTSPSAMPDTRPRTSAWNLMAVGARAEGALLDAGLTVEHTYLVPTSISDVTNLTLELLPQIESWRAKSGVSRLMVFYNVRIGASSYRPRRLQLLPIDSERLHRWRDEPWDSPSLPLFVTERRLLLSRLVREYLFVSLYRACAESLAGENASRIAAMQAAEQNIEDRLEDLRHSFNHQRQSAITEELLDIISGFEALSQEHRRSRTER